MLLNMKFLKKIYRFLKSMPLAITLLVILAAACGAASAVQQHQTAEWYKAQYGEQIGTLICRIHLDDAYHSPWFIALSACLCLSLLTCNLTRVNGLIQRTRQANEGKAGIWGAWVCHLGILVLVIGFVAGQVTQKEYTIAGLPGETLPLGGTGMQVTIHDFTIDWRDDGSAGQYTAEISITDGSGNTRTGQASVNHPASLCGYEFFQNSAGWAADVTVMRNDAILQQATLCVGESIELADDPGIYIQLLQFYPNYDGESGAASPMAAAYPEHPGYHLRLYDRFGMEGDVVLEEGQQMNLNRHAITFGNPGNYTVLVAKQDRFEWVVIAGAALILAGLIMAFYLKKVK